MGERVRVDGGLLMLNLFHVAAQDAGAIPFDPSALVAVIASAGQINVSWQDNSANELLFRLQRQVNGGGFVDLATTPTDVTSYADTAVTELSQYQYRVRAENAAGESGYYTGNTVCLAITPSQVTGITTAPTINSMLLDWPVPGGTVSGYDVERDGVIIVTDHPTDQYTDAGLAGATEYDWRVRARNDCGGVGPWSAVVTASTYELPVTSAPTLTTTVTGSQSLDLSWTAVANATFYTVEYDTDGLFSSPTAINVPSGTTYTILGLVAETEYFTRVRGDSTNPTVGPWSNVEQDTTWPALLNNFMATQNGAACPDATADLSVSTGGRTDNWIVEREDSVSGWTQILNTPFGGGSTATYQDTGAMHVINGDPENTLQYRCRPSGEPTAWVYATYNYDCLP